MNRRELSKQNNQAYFRGRAFSSCSSDPEFQEIARCFLCGEVLSRRILSEKQKMLLSLTALTASQTLGEIPVYTKAALDIGATPEEIKETLYQCAPYIGFTKVRCALDEVNGTFQDAGVTVPQDPQSTVTEETRFERGLAVQQEIFGEETIQAMRSAAPEELKHIQDALSACCFGDFYTRGTLDLPMRELITFCAICCLGGCEPQAKAHVGANLSVGNTREILIEAVTLCLPFIGFPRTLNAISCIEAGTKP